MSNEGTDMKCNIFCVKRETNATADILQRSDKHIKVVIEDTTLTIDLHRQKLSDPFIGYQHGMEFETWGDMDD
jgi:hypothetical protein